VGDQSQRHVQCAYQQSRPSRPPHALTARQSSVWLPALHLVFPLSDHHIQPRLDFYFIPTHIVVTSTIPRACLCFLPHGCTCSLTTMNIPSVLLMYESTCILTDILTEVIAGPLVVICPTYVSSHIPDHLKNIEEIPYACSDSCT